MANICFNEVVINTLPTVALDIMEHLELDDNMFNFNTLIPEPPELTDLNYVMRGKGIYYYSQKEWEAYGGTKEPGRFPGVDWCLDHPVDEFTLARIERACGTKSWKDWRLLNWGCKWNAGDVKHEIKAVDKNDRSAGGADRVYLIYRFTTPWAEPKGIIAALMAYLEAETLEVDDPNLMLCWRFMDEADHFQGEIRCPADMEEMYE